MCIYRCRAQKQPQPRPGNPVLSRASCRCHCGSWMGWDGLGCSLPSRDLFHLNFDIKKMSPWCSLLLGIASATDFILKYRCTWQSGVSGPGRCGDQSAPHSHPEIMQGEQRNHSMAKNAALLQFGSNYCRYQANHLILLEQSKSEQWEETG